MLESIMVNLTRQIKETLKGLRDVFVPNSLIFEGQVLPDQAFRLCGDEFKDDKYFLDSARAECKRLEDYDSIVL
jgi:hypothetical protein